MFLQRYFRKNSVADVSILNAHESSAAATPDPVPAKPSEAGKPKRSWRNILFGHCLKQNTNPREERTEATQSAKSTKEHPKSKRPRWFHQLLCCKRGHRVSPSPEEAPNSHENKNTANEMVLFEPLDPCDKPSKVRFNSELHVNATTEAVRKEELNTGAISRLGFPNINQSCYMNSILQSLFAMVDLIKDFTCQKPVWGSVPEAKLIRSFMAIRDAHLSSGTWNKRRLLRSFRKAASTQGLSFSDQNQEDAHEFLISVLDQMRSLSSLLEVNAASMKRRYTCPVQRHLMFQIEKTRTCKRCGAQSKRKEDFTNLSLDLIPSGSVKEMVQAYVNETELEYKCECGGNTSGQRMAFETLPNVLILHLKRFIYSPTYELVKLHDPVKLSRDLVVSSNTGDGCYGLISVVGHFGSNGQAGHYICDSVHPDGSLSQTTDHWLTFDDSVVSNTTGASVCEQRRKSSYILFYKKQV